MRTASTVATAAILSLGLMSACAQDDPVVEVPAAAANDMGDPMAAMDDMDPMDDMDAMDHSGTDMGDPGATPAYDVDRAELVQGQFVVLDSAPEGFGFGTAQGTAYLARTDDSTTATIELEGLAPDTAFVSHVHEKSCTTAGGPHFKFDPDGGDIPPNEIHLGFTTDTEGVGAMTATSDMVAGDNAVSIVIHASDGDTTKALCADLS